MSTVPPPLLGDIGTWISETFPCVGTEADRRDSSSLLRVGVDLVSVSDVVESVERFGDRYMHRMFTPHEVDCCRSNTTSPDLSVPEYSFESIAARFAAKEATLKVLRPVGPRPEWRDIEVYRADSGWCDIRLTGRAAAMAAEAGIEEWAVSLTHHASMAAAVVIGICRPAEPLRSGSMPCGQGRYPHQGEL
jgi:holo-[acyl-carrier protein] synthase